jgi:hypothetical protein
MKFRIKHSDGEVVCTRDNLLRTAELQLKVSEMDVVRLISFLATAGEGSFTNLSIGVLERLADNEEQNGNLVHSRPPSVPPLHSDDAGVRERVPDQKLKQVSRAYSPSVPARGRVKGYHCPDKEFTRSVKRTKPDPDPKDPQDKG